MSTSVKAEEFTRVEKRGQAKKIFIAVIYPLIDQFYENTERQE